MRGGGMARKGVGMALKGGGMARKGTGSDAEPGGKKMAMGGPTMERKPQSLLPGTNMPMKPGMVRPGFPSRPASGAPNAGGKVKGK
jgi:hypothetical protein